VRGRAADARKLAQLAAQIRRSIESTLVGECSDEVLQNVSVESVEPAAGNRMNVTLMVHEPGASLAKDEVMQRLEQSRGLLIQRVAEDVNRRAVPELSFWLVKAPPSS
jgi:ribosome-binding factor A